MAGFDGLGALAPEDTNEASAEAAVQAAATAATVPAAEGPAPAETTTAADGFGVLPGTSPGTSPGTTPARQRSAPRPGCGSAPAAPAAGTPTETSSDSLTSAASGSKDRKAAVLEVLAALGHERLPSASARLELDRLATFPDAESLRAENPDLRAMLAGLLGWNGDQVTKPMVKAAAAAFTASVDGVSRFAQGVEMLSFVAVCAPLLQPDRLARIMALAPQTASAYAPITATLHITEALERVLGRYDEARRERLLASLWTTSHGGRWWDATGTRPRVRRRKDAAEPFVPEDIATRRGARGARATLDELLSGEMAYSEAAARLLAHAEPSASEVETLMALTRDRRADPDLGVLIAYIPTLTPAQRTTSPIELLVDQLVAAVCDEGGVVDGALPRAPEQWGELYPEAPVTPFPIPDRVWDAFHGSAVPGFGGEARLIRNPGELAANRTHMGNCTWQYLGRSRAGDEFIGRVDHGRESYNFSVARSGRTWSITQVQGRFNRGGVPAALRTGLAALAEAASRP